MKKTLLSILAFISLQQLNAQTLTSATHNLVSGDAYTVMLYDSTTALPLTTGTNQTWDFSGNKLKSISTGTISYYTPTPGAYIPTGANLAENHMGRITYYKKSNDQTEIIGYDDYTSRFTLIPDSALTYRSFPLSYGTRSSESHSGFYSTSLQLVPSTGSLSPFYSFSALGTGTLIDPNGISYNALLVVDTFGFGITNNNGISINYIGQQLISFKYYSPNNKFPIISVNHLTSTAYSYSSSQHKMVYWEQTPTYSVEFYNPSNPTNSLSELNEEQINIYPNPAKETIQVDLAQLSTISIIDLQGKIVLNQDQENQVHVASLQPGIYSIIATDKNGQQFRSKFIKE